MTNVTRSSMPPFDEYISEIREFWDSRWLTNMGAKHRALENALEKYLGVKNICLFTNGHLALEYALECMGFEAEDEVITTPFTFASTTHAIARCRLKPVFADVKKDDFTIDPEKIEPLISERTRAIMPVHVYGNLCDTEGIDKIAKKHGLKVIYDAAHAFGVRKNGVSAACFGDLSMFSFHATKVFHTIEGGALAFSDDMYTDKLNALKNFGQAGHEDCEYAGGNAKMNEFQAAMGICNLRHLSEEILKRKTVFERYIKNLSGVQGIRVPEIQDGIEPNYAYFPVIFDSFRMTRDEVMALLAENGIMSRKYFYPLTNAFSCYKDMGYCPEKDTPIAFDAAGKVLTLPMYADLEIDEVDRITEIILCKGVR